MPVCKKCESEFPNRVKIDGKWRNTQRRQYCLECSPFGEHNTKQIHTGYKCKQCDETDANKMMNKGGGRKAKTICKKCHNRNTLARGKKNRQRYINYLGGECKYCG